MRMRSGEHLLCVARRTVSGDIYATAGLSAAVQPIWK